MGYCFMEERSHFGQVIGIRAGCAQMMNHPQIRRTRITQQSKFNNNREAFRQRSFKNSGDSTALVLGYGVGGCMAMHVQNHDQLSEPVLDDTFDAKVNANNFFYPSWYQSQCLRSVARANGQGAWHDLLPFGVSVCRACCVAGEASETNYSDDTGATAPCNFLPYKQPQLDANTKNERPHIPFGYDFDCIDGYAQDMSAVAALTHEYKGILSLAQVAGSSSAFSASLGVNSCTSNCANSKKTESLPTDVMPAAGGITYHEPTATKGKIREFSCNDVIHNLRGEGDYIDPNDHSQGKYARTDRNGTTADRTASATETCPTRLNATHLHSPKLIGSSETQSPSRTRSTSASTHGPAKALPRATSAATSSCPDSTLSASTAAPSSTSSPSPATAPTSDVIPSQRPSSTWLSTPMANNYVCPSESRIPRLLPSCQTFSPGEDRKSSASR